MEIERGGNMENNFKAFRLAKGLTQQELADRLHVVRQTVSKWEKGLSAPDAEQLLLLSEEFGVSVDTLLTAGVGKSVAPEHSTAVNAHDAGPRKIMEPRFIPLLLLLAALTLQAMPYSVTRQFLIYSDTMPDTVLRSYSYFSLHFLLYGCCVPFLSALTGLAAAVFLCFALFSEKRTKKCKIGFFISLSLSAAFSTVTFILFLTPLSGIITGILAAALALCLFIEKGLQQNAVFPQNSQNNSIK